MDRKELLKRRSIELCEILPNHDNPREDFSDESLGESIKDLNMKDPIKVRPVSEEDGAPSGRFFMIFDGDRRFEVLCELYPAEHLLKVGKDVIIDDLTREEAFDVNVTLNMQRKNYNLREECNIVEHYKEQELNQTEISKKCNRSRKWVQDRLYILKQDTVTQTQYFNGSLSIRDIGRKSADVSTSKLLDVGHPEGEPISGPAQSIIKPPKYAVHTPVFKELQEEFPDISFINVRPTGTHVGFDFAESDEIIEKVMDVAGTKQAAHLLTEQIPKEKRTTTFTKDQYNGILEDDPVWEEDIQEHQTIGDDVTIIWKSFKSKMDAIQWLHNSSERFPLTREQLEQYTELSSEEIQQIIEKDIQQEAEERIQEPEPKGSIREAMMNVSEQQYNSFIPSLRALISDEKPQKNGEILLFFRSWDDEALARRWLNPSVTWSVPKLAFPATTMHSTDLLDILTSDKHLKEHFPLLYQELKSLQNFTKNLKQISIRTLENITKSLKRLDDFKEDLKKDLKILKDQRRIFGGKEQHQKICQVCLQPKWMEPNRDVCGNCELAKRKQKKNSAAATTSGGAK